jgi:transposase
VRTFDTFTDGLILLREWLIASKVTEVAMEATGVYWKPVWDVLEGHGLEVLLVNPAHIKNVRGRKTDVKRRDLDRPAVGMRTASGQFRAAR